MCVRERGDIERLCVREIERFCVRVTERKKESFCNLCYLFFYCSSNFSPNFFSFVLGVLKQNICQDLNEVIILYNNFLFSLGFSSFHSMLHLFIPLYSYFTSSILLYLFNFTPHTITPHRRNRTRVVRTSQ